MDGWLKQSTAVTLKIGPFLDSTDGVTAETALTIAQADVRLSKNGGNYAQKNEATSCTHDELGRYGCPLDATDTNTLGILQLDVQESGALPVFHSYMVLPANVYDSLFGADLLQTDLTQIVGVAQSATDLKDFADAGYDPATNKVQGVVTVDTTTTNTDMVTEAGIADAVWDEVITAAAHAVTDSAAIYLRQLYQTIVSSVNQAQAGAAGQITLAAGESAVNDFFKGQLITITAGTGKGQSRACYGYTGSSKVALVRPNWATAPDATSWYAIGNLGSAVIAAIEDIDFTATMLTSLDAATPSVTVSDKTGFSLSAAGIDSIVDEVMEGTLTLRQAIRLIISHHVGKSSGGGTTSLTYRDFGDSKNRLVYTVDSNGNRSAVTRDAT